MFPKNMWARICVEAVERDQLVAYPAIDNR